MKELAECDNSQEDDLALAIHHLEQHVDLMTEIQVSLTKLSVPDDTSHVQDMQDQIFKAKRVLARLERSSEVSVGRAQCVPPYLGGKLDLKLPKFCGDVEKWSEFWSLFCVSVHDNPAYAPVEKLVHLKAHLVDQAEVAVQGLPITDQGYLKAVETLKERFDRPDLCIKVLMQRLLSTTPVHSDNDLVRLRRMIDGLISEVRALETMNVLPDSYAVLLMPVLLSCIPESWKIEWLRCSADSSDELTVFLKFLQKEMSIREEAAARRKRTTSEQLPTAVPGKPTVSMLNVRQKKGPDWVCLACGTGKHGLAACSAYRTMTVPVRWDVVRQAKLCYQCLGPHLLRACHSTRCPWCGGPHHSSLHPPPGEHAALMPTERCVPDRGQLSPPAAAAVSESRMPDRRPLPPPAAAGTFSANQGRMCMGVRSQQHCYVQTALVEVAGPRGVRLVRALIDGGADASFIRASLADQLGLEKVGQGTFACVGFKERVEEAHQYDQVSARLTGYQKGEAELVFWRTDKLCAPVGAPPPIQSLPPSVELADDFRDGPVDVLIGCDQLYKVVLWNQVEVNPGLRLVETVFGYVLHGQSPGQQTTRQRHAYRCQLVDVERMWTLDAVGVAAEETAERDPPVPTWNATENRYEMGLVWKSDQRPVSNLMLSKTRTHRMTEKLNVEQFQEYDDHLHQLLEDAVIEPALPSPPSEFILPHRGLHRNGKLRVVFDGSAPDGAGMSLNSYLEPGENLLHRLPAVLLNFRSGAVGCQTDIRAAFHQIVLTEEDRQFVQLLWAGQRLRFRRVPFGLTCSPYMLLCTIAEHVRRCLRDEPVLLQKVQDSVYMDDMCPSFSTRAEAEAGLTKMGDVFSEASMDLHKTRMSGDDTEDEKVLGLLWSTRSDRLAVTVPQVPCPGTRTELLSAVSRPFDPLGVVTPWLIWGKALFQRTWLDAECTWDSPLSGELQTEVRAWWRDSPGRVIWFPRLAGARDDQSGATFHVFCDASRTAYCAVVYVVQGGEPALVMSKSRLAPLSPHLTIPRLELMAAVVGARLMDFIKNALHLESATVTYWSDSTDVLHWLNRRRPLKMFVENRVKTVLQLTTADQWRQ
ncbi:uncharacterized protein LOC122370716 isoform X2 [Amphibalanus amphitrite]|uniref:uncharacterized protein LOC122370716 isoform X2 n=1 Tax=Amphibalanus amphitrite TaxID=1232801 RepID=UPI001C916E30|nr:uncharacterized protein LOC122370716 isoform X2 [Amphibalanus amphitrite]